MQCIVHFIYRKTQFKGGCQVVTTDPCNHHLSTHAPLVLALTLWSKEVSSVRTNLHNCITSVTQSMVIKPEEKYISLEDYILRAVSVEEPCHLGCMEWWEVASQLQGEAVHYCSVNQSTSLVILDLDGHSCHCYPFGHKACLQ